MTRHSMTDPIGLLLGAVATCDDCDADAALTEIAVGVYELQVSHDDACPAYREMTRGGAT